jgi:hypothetical protein
MFQHNFSKALAGTRNQHSKRHQKGAFFFDFFVAGIYNTLMNKHIVIAATIANSYEYESDCPRGLCL